MASGDGAGTGAAGDGAKHGPFPLATGPLVPVGASGLVLLGAALMRRRRAKARAQRIVRPW